MIGMAIDAVTLLVVAVVVSSNRSRGRSNNDVS